MLNHFFMLYFTYICKYCYLPTLETLSWGNKPLTMLLNYAIISM